jgi:hypothetical protein
LLDRATTGGAFSPTFVECTAHPDAGAAVGPTVLRIKPGAPIAPRVGTTRQEERHPVRMRDLAAAPFIELVKSVERSEAVQKAACAPPMGRFRRGLSWKTTSSGADVYAVGGGVRRIQAVSYVWIATSLTTLR